MTNSAVVFANIGCVQHKYLEVVALSLKKMMSEEGPRFIFGVHVVYFNVYCSMYTVITSCPSRLLFVLDSASTLLGPPRLNDVS